ncbi:putative inactive carboxylesterase 4 [Hermetia illucens]|uniref:putative inactive carboxylesterase 4 n=1 Tax=Hermetia illucens TaxID=343691 RepID=UPI0018CBF712|nr:putative inactive carboxylesterase 4 [Hermetia illucens]
MKCNLLLSIFFIAKVFSHKNHVVHEKKTFVHPLGSLGSAKCLIEESAWTQMEFYSFRDIRYAEPPTRYYRFRPTPIITKFDAEPYDATEYRKSCVNTSFGTTQNTIDETILDCLYLAVHTPKLQGNLPVMVYITGFDLLHGSNEEADPGFFMERDIVLVSIQYRVGVFGFLNANTPSIPGNGAIHDILTVLRWIRKYISLFGGNPNSVTLFGQYKVAGIIQLLTMIPEADGLFHKIICQSGSVFTENIFSFSTAAISTQIGIMLGCPNILNAKKLSDCILGASIADLNFLFWEYLKNHNGNVGLLTVGGIGGIIPYMPYESKRRGRIRSHPMIIGIVENPATYILDAFFPGQLSIFSRNHLYPIGGFDLQGEEYKHSLLDRISV